MYIVDFAMFFFYQNSHLYPFLIINNLHISNSQTIDNIIPDLHVVDYDKRAISSHLYQYRFN